jgi:hypothetical protein
MSARNRDTRKVLPPHHDDYHMAEAAITGYFVGCVMTGNKLSYGNASELAAQLLRGLESGGYTIVRLRKGSPRPLTAGERR